MAKVDIIICAFNNKNVIGDCLESIKAQSYKDFSCYLVDDCSTDGTAEFVKNAFPWVRVVRKEENSGPSISRNMALKLTHSPFIATLDSDIVLAKDWLAKQLNFLKKHPKAGIVGSKLVYASNPSKLNAAGGGMYSIGVGFDIDKGMPAKKFAAPMRCIYACSAAMMVRREVFSTAGLFDNTFFYGHEDTDIGWRANIAGFECWANNEAVAKHRVSETMKNYSQRVFFHATKNRIRMILKNYEIHNVVKFAFYYCLVFLGEIALKGHRLAKLRGLVWNILNLPSTLVERKKVQKTRRNSDATLSRFIETFPIGKYAPLVFK